MTGRGWVVLCKEFIDNLRDRRSIAMALLVAVMGPLALIPVLHMVGHLAGEPTILHVPVQGAELAPGLMEYLRARHRAHRGPRRPRSRGARHDV